MDWNQLIEAEQSIGLDHPENLPLRIRWINKLRDIVCKRMPKNKAGNPIISDVDVMRATLEERIEALRVLTAGK